MALFLIGSVIFAVLTLGTLAAFLITGGKNRTLRYLAGAFSILASLCWIIQTLMQRRR